MATRNTPSALELIQTILQLAKQTEKTTMKKKTTRKRTPVAALAQYDQARASAFVAARTEQSRAKKNKVKYTCPTCNVNVWAKPDVAIKCGTDDELMLIASRSNRDRKSAVR